VTLAPLLNGSTRSSAFATTPAFAIGVIQLAALKGTLPHRTVGWIWGAPDGCGGPSSAFIRG
jgi:uncharacterized membrane protein